jgi:hypothetical protein
MLLISVLTAAHATAHAHRAAALRTVEEAPR